MTTDLTTRRAWLAEQYPQWVPRTLAQHLTVAAQAFPERAFVLTDERTYTYRKMREWARALAKGLIASGVRPGEHVAMVLANYPEFIAVKFAIAYAGAVAVPLNYRLRTEELRYVLRQSDSVALFTMDRFRDLDYLEMLDQIAPGWRRGAATGLPRLHTSAVHCVGNAPTTVHGARTFADLIGAGTEVAEHELDARERAGAADDLADLMYTSGTTGSPKGALLTHDSVLRCACSSAFIRGFGPERRTLFALPLYHVFSYVEGLLATMWVGGAIAPQVEFSPEATFDAITKHGIDEALFVPTMTVAALDHPAQHDYDLSSLTSVMSASAPAPLRLWQQLRDQWSVEEIVTAYGQTEASASTTYTMPDDPLELVSATVGRPKPGYTAAARDLDGLVTDYKTLNPATSEELAPGREGELAVYGPQIMQRYYNKPDETAAVLDTSGWLRSGDLGRVREDGYVVLTGRSKELYKRGSELVSPKEIEELLTSRPDVSQAYVVGVPDELMGEVGCAFVVQAPGKRPSSADLLACCRDNLARFKVPEHVIFIDGEALPTTPTGKVQKFRLAEQATRRISKT